MAAVLLYLGLALYQTYPAWVDGAHGVVGLWTHPDMISNHWLYRWVAERISSGQSIIHNDRYYVPVGDGPWLAGNGSDAIPYTLFALLLPWPASATAWVVVSIALNGLSGYALSRKLGAGLAGAVVAGGAVAFSPYIAEELAGARFAQLPLYWTGFFLVAWHSLLERAPEQGPWQPDRGTWGRALVAALLYGMASFTYWYAGLWAALAGVIWFAFRPRARALVAFVPLALLTTLPPLIVFLSHWSEIPGTAETSFPHPLTLQASLPIPFPVTGGTGFWAGVVLPMTLVLPALGALILAAWERPSAGTGAAAVRERLRGAWQGLGWGERGALATAALFYLLCLGPYPSWTGEATGGLPGPYWLFYGLGGPLRRFWWPYRHIAVLTLALAPIAARGLDRAIAWLASQSEPGVRPLVPALATVVLVAALPAEVGARGGTLSSQSSGWSEPTGYQKLAALPGDVILELPIAPGTVTGQQTLSYQWVHHKRLLNGHAMWVDRVRPAAWDTWVAGNSFLVELQELERGEHDGPFVVDAKAVRALQEVGLRYLVVNQEYFPAELEPLVEVYRGLFTSLFGAPVLDEPDQLRAWDVNAYSGAASADVLPFRLPVALRGDSDGGRLPLVGQIDSLGWTTVSRSFPPDLGTDEAQDKTSADSLEAK